MGIEKTQSDYKRYTLIELLVTITIIAILASLLITSMKVMQGREKQLGCTNQLRNIGAASVDFTGDKNSKLPLGNWKGTSEGYGWDDQLRVYLGGSELSYNWLKLKYWKSGQGLDVLKCPASHTELEYEELAYRPTGTYVMPMRYDIDTRPEFIAELTSIDPGEGATGRPLTSVLDPAGTIYLTENDCLKGGSYQGNARAVGDPLRQLEANSNGLSTTAKANYTSLLHADGKVNYLLMDGRVKAYDPQGVEVIGTDGEIGKPEGMWTLDPND